MTRLAVDASAIIAVLNREAEQQSLSDALIDVTAIIGAPTLLEVHIWLRRRQDRLQASWLDDWLVRETTQVVPFDERLERAAALAYHRFGKGQHRANLNFGDCMAYAVAKQENLPLLFKGGDFGQTFAVIHPASIVLSG